MLQVQIISVMWCATVGDTRKILTGPIIVACQWNTETRQTETSEEACI